MSVKADDGGKINKQLALGWKELLLGRYLGLRIEKFVYPPSAMVYSTQLFSRAISSLFSQNMEYILYAMTERIGKLIISLQILTTFASVASRIRSDETSRVYALGK